MLDKIFSLRGLLFATVITSSFSLMAQPQIIHNVKGYTLNDEGKLVNFSALAFEDGKILATGDENLSKKYPQAQLTDGQQRTLLPGLIDAHGHLVGLGTNLLQVDVRDIASAKKTVEKVAAYAKQNEQLSWIVGRGWNQVLWPEKQYPTAKMLDELISDRPVYLERVDGHAAWVNTKAMEMAGINKDTLDPPGGKFVRDPKGDPTGVLIDNAMNALSPHLPDADPAFLSRAIQTAGEHLLSLGITSMHDAGIDYEQYTLYQKLAKQQQLPVRVYAMIAATEPRLKTMLKNGYISDKQDLISIRSVKAYGDGALGSRGAALLEPYADAHDNKGLLVTQMHDLQPLFDTVIGADFQLNFHAIGDRANRLALHQFGDTFERLGGKQLRHRIEHAQVVNVDDIPLFKKYNIIPSMQPTHATSDMNMAEDRIGKTRLKGAYAWQTFIEQGSPIALGSDFPVELANPFFGLHAAVTRQDRQAQPEQGWIKSEALSLTEAFRGFTYNAAYAAHQEDIIGTLEAGKWADFILIDKDIFALPPQQIWQTTVLQTWLAGEKVYQKECSAGTCE